MRGSYIANFLVGLNKLSVYSLEEVSEAHGYAFVKAKMTIEEAKKIRCELEEFSWEMSRNNDSDVVTWKYDTGKVYR